MFKGISKGWLRIHISVLPILLFLGLILVLFGGAGLDELGEFCLDLAAIYIIVLLILRITRGFKEDKSKN